MSKVLERLRKKHGHAVTIGEETFYVRALTIGEWRRSDKMKGEERTGFIVGCALCDGPDGVQTVPQNAGEEDAAWAMRVLEELIDVQSSVITEIINGITPASKTVPLETIAKN